MIFPEELRDTIHTRFLEIKSNIGILGENISERLDKCYEDERLIMEFFYGAMPASDIGDYDFDFLRKFAKFGVFLANNCEWFSLIPPEIFLDFVVFYRVNNENLDDCRSFFYNEIKDRIKEKNMYEAALAVNLWCAEHVTYRSTDIRTVSPLTAYKSSYGRCGEESTFVVTAMRSVGIPARQVYTPKWAHCDDNHAWVEVWCDGKWYFLGACEPEPALNRGWFVEAAARAMLVNCNSNLLHDDEEIIEKIGRKTMLNQLGRYAPTVKISVNVLSSGNPVRDAVVSFELLNEAEISPIARVLTDAYGKAVITLGRGSVFVRAFKDGYSAEKLIDTRTTENLVLEIEPITYKLQSACEDFYFEAPEDFPSSTVSLTDEQKRIKHIQIECADNLRQTYHESFYDSEKAQDVAKKFAKPEVVLNILKAAEGNFAEIYEFLCTDFGDENRELQLDMLLSLSVKDYRDALNNVLSEHFRVAIKYKNECPKDIFVSYVLCPRVRYEQLTSCVEVILAEIGECLHEMRKNPKLIWDYVIRFHTPKQYEDKRIICTPAGTIRCGIADEEGGRVLFVAICRTIGIPARIETVSSKVQFWEKDRFVFVDEEAYKKEISALILHGGDDTWSYMHNWSISVLENDEYRTLDLSGYMWSDGKLMLELPAGIYRIITTTRLPNGNQYAKKYSFSLVKGQKTDLEIKLRHIDIKDLLVNIKFSPFDVYTGNGEPISIFKISDCKTTVLIWAEEGREPTEHILNEFIQLKDDFNRLDCDVVLLVQNKSALVNKTFAEACASLKRSKVYITDFSETASAMVRRMYVNSDNLPLTVIMSGESGIFACSGYNVGTVELISRIIKSTEN